jgi:hypothetical protein
MLVLQAEQWQQAQTIVLFLSPLTTLSRLKGLLRSVLPPQMVPSITVGQVPQMLTTATHTTEYKYLATVVTQ